MRRNARRFGADLVLAVVAAASAARNADLHDPPRYDGAGYAILGEALATGRGYREINRPDAPRHAHFPPGYPAALAVLHKAAGRSAAVAHAFSILCTTASAVLAWRLFRSLYAPRTAFLLGLAVAANWTWGRVGGSIQSEPFYILLEMLAVLASLRAGRLGGSGPGAALGLALGGCLLTRHVGACLAMASAIDLALRRRWQTLSTALATAAFLVLPWALWLTRVRENTQVGLLPTRGFAAQAVAQGLFYLRRIPDQVTGPFVEVATVFGRHAGIARAADAWAVVASGIVLWGWLRALRVPRRRLAALIPLATLALLLAWPFTEAGRFLIPLLPFVLMGAVEGLSPILARFMPKRAKSRAAGLVLAASIPYAAYAIASGRADAQRRTNADYDAACAWLSREAPRPGPVLSRHAGEVYWQTGRTGVPPIPPEPESIDRLIRQYRISYLLVDDDRYANAEPNPLSRYAEQSPGRVKLVWSRRRGNATVRIFEVRTDQR